MSIRIRARRQSVRQMDNMIRINLLDWREAVREERRRGFLGALTLTALASAGIIAFVTLFIYGHRIDAQQHRNHYLQQQIDIAGKKMVELKKVKTERASLIRRIHIIEDLQRSRSWIVHYFDQVVATVPDGVFLKSLRQSADTTTLDGVAESNARVSQYMVNLDHSPYLADPQLVVIKSGGRPGHRYAAFTLNISSEHPDPTSARTDSDQQLAEVSQ